MPGVPYGECSGEPTVIPLSIVYRELKLATGLQGMNPVHRVSFFLSKIIHKSSKP
jgi:hypothetical protein